MKKNSIHKLSQRESTYWSPHLLYFTFSEYMVGPRSLISKSFNVQKYVMPDLKALMCIKLRKENLEFGNFLKMYCALLKIGVFNKIQVRLDPLCS